tara:strand:+ start:568 stop:807 length:240 start_codon:yes stop_codon:yes gene_type:complete
MFSVKLLSTVPLFCFFQLPPHSASLPYGVRPATRCAGAVLFDLATGSMVISRSEIKMEIEPKPLAVSLSALVKLMQPEG